MAAANAQKLMGKRTTVQTAAVSPQQQLVSSAADNSVLRDISKSLANIIQLLTQQNNQTIRDSEQTRKNQERSKRIGIESGLESTFSAAKSVASAIVAPVKGIIGQIIQSLITIFLGRALINLITWFADPKNESKIKSITRFLGDWWPTLLAAYILFGTGFGRVTRSLAGIALRGVFALGKVAANLAKAIFRARAAKTAAAAGGSAPGAGGGWKSALGKLGIFAAGAGVGAITASVVSGGDQQSPPPVSGGEQPVPQAPGIPMLGAFTGGLADIKTLFSGGGPTTSSKFSPFGSSLGPQVLGKVSGPKGIDKVPAMLTDGEFVMSRGAVQKYGVGTLESMNAAGGGTNKPKVIRGVPHAAGGGYIGTAADLIKKEEALSSLSPQKNDYIFPRGKSIVTGVDWSKIKPETKLHSYKDSYGIPTIGWGSTFYDKLSSGSKPVKMGDVITKSQADVTLNTQLGNLSQDYSKKIKYWPKMSDNQKAAILSFSYNAGPNAVLGSYPKLSAALNSGDMKSVAINIQRKGPSAERIRNEQNLLLSGPKDLSKVQSPKPSTKPKEKPSLLDRFSSSISQFISGKPSKTPGFFGGGSVKGKKGIDKVPAMLTDGEFVMSPGAVKKFGTSTLESMNISGGGTNKPKIVNAVPHAFGGGEVSKKPLPAAKFAKTSSTRNQITPTPKPSPKVSYMSSGGSKSVSKPMSSTSGSQVPRFGSSTGSNRKAANVYGIK